ncbi:hypothetical protein [Nocardia tengchongensis]|uniref:hypothetical protein n=1 Tax=Nocardia tengchongensis TaxID=2055889 RepID=UPI0036493016
MSGMGEQYAELDDALTRRRGVPELEDLLSVWDRLDRLDAGLPHVPDPGRRRQLTQASDRTHQHLLGAWRELGIAYETALAVYRNWAADRQHPTLLSTLDRPAPQIPDRPHLPEQRALPERPPEWDGFDR